MATPCYSGPNPVTDEERIAIWRWAKANGIDQGLPFEKVGDAINQKFFGGAARPEWITDILGGRKTPFREVANAAWKAQYNRRVITQQAKALSQTQGMPPVLKALHGLWTLPRSISVTGHGFVFPVSHAGDLIFRPASWANFFKGAFDTYRGAYSEAFTARALSDIESRSLFTTALRSGLDVGAGSKPSGLLGSHFEPLKRITGSSHQAWEMLTVMRYKLWENQMQKFIKPGMSQADILDIGKNLAAWANHATGSAKNPLPFAGEYLFGPKLTASKWARMVSDPIQTIKTFAGWNQASAGEKAAALTRLSGAGQYAGTLIGFLAANQGLLMTLGSKQNVNFTDPTKSDWLSFKGLGLVGSMPGLHSEIRTLGKMLTVATMSDPEFAKHFNTQFTSKGGEEQKAIWNYARGKLSPSAQIVADVLTGTDVLGRPEPWSAREGKKGTFFERLSWWQYALDHLPIPAQGPAAYFNEKLKAGGMSPLDAATVTRGIILSGLTIPGLHAHEEPPPKPPKQGVKR